MQRLDSDLNLLLLPLLLLCGGPCGVGISTLEPLMTRQKSRQRGKNEIKRETAHVEHDHVVKIDLNSCFRYNLSIYWDTLGTIKPLPLLLVVTKFTLVCFFFSFHLWIEGNKLTRIPQQTVRLFFFSLLMSSVSRSMDEDYYLLGCRVFWPFLLISFFFILLCNALCLSIQWHIL